MFWSLNNARVKNHGKYNVMCFHASRQEFLAAKRKKLRQTRRWNSIMFHAFIIKPILDTRHSGINTRNAMPLKSQSQNKQRNQYDFSFASQRECRMKRNTYMKLQSRYWLDKWGGQGDDMLHACIDRSFHYLRNNHAWSQLGTPRRLS